MCVLLFAAVMVRESLYLYSVTNACCAAGVPPPRLVRPLGLPPGLPPPGLQAGAVNPGILSAPPSIMKPPQRTTPAASTDDDSSRRESSSSATIEAKPQIRHVIGDVTRFMPTALRVKREMKDSKGHVIKPATIAAAAMAPQLPGKQSEVRL